MTATIIKFNHSDRCAHNRVIIDDSCNEVICQDCGKTVNPVWALKRFSMQESQLQYKLRDLDKQVTRKENELKKLKQEIKVAKQQ